ncbi:hypothetical protein ACXYO7_004724 [Salmonella enterica subsp. enterica]
MTNNKQTDVKRFTKKPVTISAIQWTGDNLPDVIEFTGKHPRWGDWFADMGEYIAHVRSDGNRFKIFTLEGAMDALPGDWIIRGVQGEHYPCKPDIFAATYDPAELQERRKAEVPEYPETLPCPVFLEPGLKFGKGVRTQCVLDALRRRADYYAELEAMTPEQRAGHDADIAEFKATLQGSQPVSDRDELREQTGGDCES